MIKAFISDFSRVLLSPKDDNYSRGLNSLHERLSADGNYDFWSYFRLNQDLLAFYKALGEKIDVYMFTTKYIQEHPPLAAKFEGVFKAIFSATRLNLKKNNFEAYKKIADKIRLKPEEILYMDDKQKNLDAAKEAGMIVIRYESNNQAIKDINKTLKNFISFNL